MPFARRPGWDLPSTSPPARAAPASLNLFSPLRYLFVAPAPPHDPGRGLNVLFFHLLSNLDARARRSTAAAARTSAAPDRQERLLVPPDL